MNKKLKRKLHKKFQAVKESIEAQVFHLKQMGSVAKDAAKSFFLGTGLVALVAVGTLGANKFHLRYIESHVGDQVVFIKSPDDARLQGSGTGFEIKAQSGKVYTVTNAHVCGLANSNGIIMVEEKRSNRLIPRRVLEVYNDNDLCLVEGLEGYSGLDTASGYERGEPVWAVGYPLGGMMNISNGRIKGEQDVYILAEDVSQDKCVAPKYKKIQYNLFGLTFDLCAVVRHAIDSDVVIYPGNSGSPLVNIYGNVVGVVFAADQRTNWGSSVPLRDLNKLLGAY